MLFRSARSFHHRWCDHFQWRIGPLDRCRDRHLLKRRRTDTPKSMCPTQFPTQARLREVPFPNECNAGCDPSKQLRILIPWLLVAGIVNLLRAGELGAGDSLVAGDRASLKRYRNRVINLIDQVHEEANVRPA